MTNQYTATQTGPTHFTICYEAQPVLTLSQAVDKPSLLRLIAQCNADELDPLHLPEVMADYLWAAAHNCVI